MDDKHVNNNSVLDIIRDSLGKEVEGEVKGVLREAAQGEGGPEPAKKNYESTLKVIGAAVKAISALPGAIDHTHTIDL